MMKKHPAYKDSGLDWLAEVPSHWAIERVKTVVKSTTNGIWGDDAKQDQNDIVCIRVADFDFEHLSLLTDDLTLRNIPEAQRKERLVLQGDLLIEKSGGGENQPVGRTVRNNLNVPAVSSNFIGKITIEPEKVTPDFLLFALKALYQTGIVKRSIKQTTGIQNLDLYSYFCERIPLPPLEEQNAIVAFLEEQTAVINQFLTNKRRLIALLEEQKQVVINTAVTQGLDTAVARKPSGIDWLGDIPAHWEIKKLKYVAEVQTGLTLGQKYPNIPLIERPYLRVANVQDGYLDLAEITTVQLPVDKASRYELEIGDVLMTEGGDYDKLGRGYVWEGQIDNCLHQNHIFAVRPKKEVLKPYFLTAIMSSLHGKEYFIESSKQTTNLASINSSKLKRFPVLLPTLKEQQDILDYLEQKTAEINAAIERTQREIALIEEYRTTLIAHAVTGKIDVRPGALLAPASVAPPSPPPGSSRATQPAAARHGAMHGEEEKE